MPSVQGLSAKEGAEAIINSFKILDTDIIGTLACAEILTEIEQDELEQQEPHLAKQYLAVLQYISFCKWLRNDNLSDVAEVPFSDQEIVILTQLNSKAFEALKVSDYISASPSHNYTQVFRHITDYNECHANIIMVKNHFAKILKDPIFNTDYLRKLDYTEIGGKFSRKLSRLLGPDLVPVLEFYKTYREVMHDEFQKFFKYNLLNLECIEKLKEKIHDRLLIDKKLYPSAISENAVHQFVYINFEEMYLTSICDELKNHATSLNQTSKFSQRTEIFKQVETCNQRYQEFLSHKKLKFTSLGMGDNSLQHKIETTFNEISAFNNDEAQAEACRRYLLELKKTVLAFKPKEKFYFCGLFSPNTPTGYMNLKNLLSRLDQENSKKCDIFDIANQAQGFLQERLVKPWYAIFTGSNIPFFRDRRVHTFYEKTHEELEGFCNFGIGISVH